VGGLDNNTGEEEVRKYFSKFGDLEEVLIWVNPDPR
jgi:hypothetical protein